MEENDEELAARLHRELNGLKRRTGRGAAAAALQCAPLPGGRRPGARRHSCARWNCALPLPTREIVCSAAQRTRSTDDGVGGSMSPILPA